MAKIEFSGVEQYSAALQKLSADAKDKILGAAIYDAAGIVADAIQNGISTIPTIPHFVWAKDGEQVNGLLDQQKAALHASLGIAKIKNEQGILNVKIGWDGYNNIRTRRWTKGQPNQMIARSIERGTSWLKGTKFVQKAVSASKPKAVEAMQKRIDEESEKILK